MLFVLILILLAILAPGVLWTLLAAPLFVIGELGGLLAAIAAVFALVFGGIFAFLHLEWRWRMRRAMRRPSAGGAS